VAAAERLRLLRIIARLNVGGPALHVSYLTDRLAERGFDTTLVAGQVTAAEGSMEYVAEDYGVAPVFIPQLRRDISVLPDLSAIRRLGRLIEEIRPDIVHTHTAKAGAVGRIAALTARQPRRPIVVHTFHGHVLRGYFRRPVTAFFTSLERRLARASDALIAVSPQVRDELVELGVAPASRIVVIRLGLDLESRLKTDPGARSRIRAELGVDDGSFLIGWLGRMTEIKRIDDLLRAFAAVRRDGVDATLALVGDGPLAPGLRDQAARLGVLDRCRFVGFRADVGQFYAAFDAVALSSANEGTPVTLIEAQAAGLPVVATAVGGTPDVVADGETGFLVPAGDSSMFAARLGELAGSTELSRRLGDAGRVRASSRYAVSRLIDDMDDLYRSLVAARSARDHVPVRRSSSQSVPVRRALPPPTAGLRRPSRRLRVVLLSQYFPPEIGATQSRMQSFAEHLTDRGHDVTVICEFPNHPHGRIPGGYAGMLMEDDRSNPYRVLRVWVLAHPEKTQLTRMELYLSYMTMAVVAAPWVGRADVVLATSPPLFTGIAGAAIARMNGAPLVLDVRDLWPAAAISLDQIKYALAARVSEGLEKWLYREADATTSVTRPFCEYIDRFRPEGPRTVLIPNGTLDLFFDGAADGGRGTLGVEADDFLVTFAGTHGIAQGLPAIVESAALLDDGFTVAFVGDGPVRENLIAEATARGLTNVRFHPQTVIERMPPLLAASDALLVPLSGHSTFETFVPSKLIDFMAVGRPVILSAAGEAARLVNRAGAGVVVSPEDPAALAEAIRWLRDHPEEARRMGERGREFARKRLRSVQAERLEEVLLAAADRTS
jgi:glycosyltransferase involved in cell wall biosynthesis